MGRTQGFQSSGNFNGYRVFMTQTMPAIWVKDPTKVLKKQKMAMLLILTT